MTREQWLRGAAERLSHDLALQGAWPLHVSVGFPRGRRGRVRPVGQCWDGALSADRRPHVFVSPVLAEPVGVLATLLHELVHAEVGSEAHHRGAFITTSRRVGLLKPWTATTSSEDLLCRLNALAAELGGYPHAALTEKAQERSVSRLRLWECACPVKVRVASDRFAATCDDCEAPFERA